MTVTAGAGAGTTTGKGGAVSISAGVGAKGVGGAVTVSSGVIGTVVLLIRPKLIKYSISASEIGSGHGPICSLTRFVRSSQE